MNTITIELCAEDRERLDRIYEALTQRQTDLEYVMNKKFDHLGSLLENMELNAMEAAPAAVLEVVKPEPEEAPAEKPEAPKVKVEDVQQKVVALSAAGKKAEVRDIVKAYADKVSAIPEDKLAEVMQKLSALGG